MLSDANPYAPGSGLKPKVLEGRDLELAAVDTVVARARNRLQSRAVVLSGLRGVGKTVLLNAFRAHAEKMDWITVPFEARGTESGRGAVRAKLARELVVATRRTKVVRRSKKVADAVASIGSFSASLSATGVTLGIERRPGRADSGVLEIDLEEMVTDVADALRSEGLGLAFFVDEMQDLDAELLSALLAAQHAAGQNSLPYLRVRRRVAQPAISPLGVPLLRRATVRLPPDRCVGSRRRRRRPGEARSAHGD